MINKLLTYLQPILLVVILILVIPSASVFGGATNYDSVDVTDGYLVDGTTVIDGSGNFDGAITGTSATFSGTVTIGSGGTAINKYKCYSDTTFDPGSVSSSTAAATVVFLTPSATAGDIVLGSVATTTSAELWRVDAKVTAGSGTATASSTLYLRGVDGAAVNLTTTTAKLCIIN